MAKVNCAIYQRMTWESAIEDYLRAGYVPSEQYRRVYAGEMDVVAEKPIDKDETDALLEAIERHFNREPPRCYSGLPLTVGDVIMLERESSPEYFCHSLLGFCSVEFRRTHPGEIPPALAGFAIGDTLLITRCAAGEAYSDTNAIIREKRPDGTLLTELLAYNPLFETEQFLVLKPGDIFHKAVLEEFDVVVTRTGTVRISASDPNQAMRLVDRFAVLGDVTWDDDWPAGDALPVDPTGHFAWLRRCGVLPGKHNDVE